jgi:hypothetical protein
MNRIERVVVDECVGQESPLVAQLRQRLGGRRVTFVFLETERPGIPDIEILDKLLDARSALLTQDRVLHNLAIGRGFQSFAHTPESGLTDRRLAHVSAASIWARRRAATCRLLLGNPARGSDPAYFRSRSSNSDFSHPRKRRGRDRTGWLTTQS